MSCHARKVVREKSLFGGDAPVSSVSGCWKRPRDKKSAGSATREKTGSATYPARAMARPQQVLLRVIQADPAHLFIWCFANGGERGSAARARFADDRGTDTRRDGCRCGGREGGFGSSGATRRGPEPSRRARRDATTAYLRGPPPAPRTWSVGDPCRTPWSRTGWRGKGACSNGVRANTRWDAGSTREFRVARVRRARRGVGHADVRVSAGETRETPDVARIVRFAGPACGRARGV